MNITIDINGTLIIIAIIFFLYGNIQINFKNKKGFLGLILMNIILITISLISDTANWFLTIMFIGYILLNLHGILFWYNSEK